ncbi:MAG TPA: hypothetical protein VKA85_06910 [Candidatus Limnocylindrales bacterium]|nr:hypothetical protein [Candidatus Limnocylindrales bacterium]
MAVAREPSVRRTLRAIFESPRAAFRATARLRHELPDVDVALAPDGADAEGAEPARVVVRGRVPWRRSRSAVRILSSVDPSVRISWESPRRS